MSSDAALARQRRYRSKPQVCARRAALERKRYAEDPTRRERIVARMRHLRHTNPAYKARQRESSRRWKLLRRKRAYLCGQLAFRGYVLAGGLG